MAKSMSLIWREAAADNRYYASLAICPEAQNDHLRWALFLENLADTLDQVLVDYSAITREVALHP